MVRVHLISLTADQAGLLITIRNLNKAILITTLKLFKIPCWLIVSMCSLIGQFHMLLEYYQLNIRQQQQPQQPMLREVESISATTDPTIP
jgi:hypothetical protein